MASASSTMSKANNFVYLADDFALLLTAAIAELPGDDFA